MRSWNSRWTKRKGVIVWKPPMFGFCPLHPNVSKQPPPPQCLWQNKKSLWQVIAKRTISAARGSVKRVVENFWKSLSISLSHDRSIRRINIMGEDYKSIRTYKNYSSGCPILCWCPYRFQESFNQEGKMQWAVGSIFINLGRSLSEKFCSKFFRNVVTVSYLGLRIRWDRSTFALRSERSF